jgi:hypothetical protein
MTTDMKFQSLIQVIMHGIQLPARAALFAFGVGTISGCVSLIAKKNTYDAAATSPAVKVNGADIRIQLKPEGTSGGSYALSAMVVSTTVATLDGPFRWRIEATGQHARQEYLVVHQIRTRTGKSQRDERFPRQLLGKKAEFKRTKDGTGTTRAIYPIPGRLEVKPLDDGFLEIFVDLSVVTAGNRQRRLVRFRMDPAEKRQDEFIFVPTEIIRNIGKSPSEWEESAWD